ncbi:hypothetical protein A3B84_00060 [Candidatus Nomurabacteria bacterium RIFCSPHIGHO2_02_FULL_35_13]|uniref:Ada DNA repair metal-binding domain-containing protein n=1 Tax=Candidatus Nomurabacteria bacterium RIFCSPHIGHO2_02_FULL_35_13 TaxID=1801748 RepID=A0A1F6VQC6_9BACT|nr:MAG: hypothetical protein A3B84_00060 [Candidatus Nomurabacteria bacterium RIFCSPHIGHO2_02_FULL_35_13]
MEKIKQFSETDKGKDIFVIIIIILVGLGSFGLGRLSKSDSNKGIKIEYEGQEANVIKSVESSSLKNFFASNRGTKYYSISCGAGKTIKEENRVYFETSTEAESAGYELSSSCR